MVMTFYLKKKFFFVIIAFLTAPVAVFTQAYTNADRANYIIDIAQYVTWANEKEIDIYTIGLLDRDSVLYHKFVEIAAHRNIQGKPIKIRLFDNIQDIRNCQMVFLHRQTGFDIDMTYNHISGTNTLLISENFPFHKSMINFIVLDDRKRFEMNNKRMSAEGFTTTVTFAAMAVKTELDWYSIYKETEKELLQQKEKVEEQKLMIEQQRTVLEDMLREVETERNRLLLYIEEIELLEEEIDVQGDELLVLLNRIRQRESMLLEQERALDSINLQVRLKEKENIRQQSILNEQISSIEVQETLIEEQKKILSEQLEKLHYQTLIINLGIALLLLFLGLVYFIYRGYRIKKQSNIKLEEKNKVITQQKELVEKEKEKSDQLLLNILPSKVAEDLKIKGYTEPEEFREVSVLFTDFIGFTEKASALEPRVLIKELNELYTAFDNIMQEDKCERIKTIGDAYMAVCGMPVLDENHAQNITEAAKKIIAYLENRNKIAPIKWHIRIGIHSGKVVGGIVGVKKFIYDVFGDTINVAARMESSGESMRINMSESTYRLLKDKYSFEERKQVEVKGKGKQNMYFLN